MSGSASCKACATAALKTHHGFVAGCAGCLARSAARSPHFRRVKLAGRLDSEYRRMLDQLKVTHEQVRSAAAADAYSGKDKP